MSIEILQPKEWVVPRGYANGIATRGKLVFVAGQIGWDAQGRLVSSHFAEQAHQVFRNIARVLAEADARPEHVVRMTWYVTDIQAYRDQYREIGQGYREIFGKHFPAMALVQVAALVEPHARIEIEATAVVPD